MVGIPRSKGCANCRKRKVACDQTKPECRVCQKRGVSCEGYAKYPVVLQWTNKGLKKRERFEEVAPAPRSTETTYVSTHIIPLNAVSINGSSTSASARTTPDFNIIPMSQPHDGTLVLQQIEARCMESYFGSGGAVVPDVKTSWMWHIMELTARGKVLDSAFAALSLVRVGTVNSDKGLVIHGRRQYAFALTNLQKALYDPDLAFQDRTLAAMRTLSIYELLSPTFDSSPHGKTHEDGMVQWCLAAGPRSINSEFALMVFQDVRWSLMIHCIDSSKSSVLGEEGWLTTPWLQYEKDSLQQLFDFGFSIAAVLEKIEGKHDMTNPSTAAHLSALCFDVKENLDLWYVKHWGTLDQSTILMLAGLFEASNLVYYWWFKMTLNQAVMSINKHLRRHLVQLDSDLSPQSVDTSLQTENTRLATDIVRAAPFFSADGTGWLGPMRNMFPLKLAMAHLSAVESPAFAEAQTALMQLVKKLRG